MVDRYYDGIDTPVALFAYQRPTLTERVVERIVEAEPPIVYLVMDGIGDDTQLENGVRKTRQLLDEIEWPCSVRTNYADDNLGIRERFATGLKWVFDNEERAIILEDDTLPSQSFFRFCDVLLDRYEDDPRVFDITGFNYLDTWHPQQPSNYLFSAFGGIWGWATWRRSFELYDPSLHRWGNYWYRQRIRENLTDPKLWSYAKRRYRRTYNGELDAWDYQWTAARHEEGALSVVPRFSLVQNIGFGDASSNTDEADHPLADIRAREIVGSVDHPETVERDIEYDRAYYHQMRHRLDHPLIQRAYDFVEAVL